MNQDTEIVQQALEASKQASTLREAAINKLLEQRKYIDESLEALGYKPQPMKVARVSNISSIPGDERTFPPYDGPADFAHVNAELQRRARHVSHIEECSLEQAIDKVLVSDKALLQAYGTVPPEKTA